VSVFAGEGGFCGAWAAIGRAAGERTKKAKNKRTAARDKKTLLWKRSPALVIRLRWRAVSFLEKV
jgi:hypothetical protein